jgi:DNA-binding NarL/FixJ family response regulator
MQLRVLFAVPDRVTESMLHSVLDAALRLTPLSVTAATAFDQTGLVERAAAALDDIILLDWGVAESGTPELVRRLIATYPQVRIVVLVPENHRQYRCEVWNAGACNGIPREHIDQEWLSTVLCLMHRAMEREARLIQRFAQGVTHG